MFCVCFFFCSFFFFGLLSSYGLNLLELFFCRYFLSPVLLARMMSRALDVAAPASLVIVPSFVSSF